MKHSDELFRLIRSLSRSEKRYFKLFTDFQRGRKNYLRLFDAIDQQQEYDEKELKDRFRDEKFINQFNVAKKYLYDLVLRSLRSYHSGWGVTAQARDLIRSAEILHGKGKVDPEAFASEEGIDNEFDLLFEALRRFHTELNYERILFKINHAHLNETPRSASRADYYARIGISPLLGTEPPDISLRSRVLRLLSLCMYHHVQGDQREALRYADSAIELIESHPAYLAEHPLWGL